MSCAERNWADPENDLLDLGFLRPNLRALHLVADVIKLEICELCKVAIARSAQTILKLLGWMSWAKNPYIRSFCKTKFKKLFSRSKEESSSEMSFLSKGHVKGCENRRSLSCGASFAMISSRTRLKRLRGPSELANDWIEEGFSDSPV